VRTWALCLYGVIGCWAIVSYIQGSAGAGTFLAALAGVGLILEATASRRRARGQRALEDSGAFRALLLRWTLVASALLVGAVVLIVGGFLAPPSDPEPWFVYGVAAGLFGGLIGTPLIIAYRKTNGGRDLDKLQRR
jgi:hypothetical protein